MNTIEQFEVELRRLIKKRIAVLKRGGTVAMSADNLWQVTAGHIGRECPNAPLGTNCASVARLAFNEVITLPTIAPFILPERAWNDSRGYLLCGCQKANSMLCTHGNSPLA